MSLEKDYRDWGVTFPDVDIRAVVEIFVEGKLSTALSKEDTVVPVEIFSVMNVIAPSTTETYYDTAPAEFPEVTMISTNLPCTITFNGQDFTGVTYLIVTNPDASGTGDIAITNTSSTVDLEVQVAFTK